MVLSAPAAHAAPPAAPWLDRLTRIFHLGQGRGVLVLVRGAPERLGEVVRHVANLAPDVDLLLRAEQLASLPPQSTVVLRLRPEDFDWLNIGRPVVLGHRIVLFGDPETALALERSSFDFFDWISHRIDAPVTAPAFAIRSLKNAANQRSEAIVWRGTPVDRTFSEALPGRALSRISAAQRYAALVVALRPAPRTWALITDLDEAFRVRRARWAIEEAGRRGRTLLFEPGVQIEDLPIVHGAPMDLDEAASKLEQAGVEHGARLAALLDLDPDAIERAATLAAGGAKEADLVRALVDAGTIRIHSVSPSGSRAISRPSWPDRVALALRYGDDEVAIHQATSWRAAEPENPRATATLAYARIALGKPEGARALLEEAIRQAGESPDAETAFELRRLEGLIHETERDLGKALAAFEEAIRLTREVHRSAEEVDGLHLSRVRTLIGLGHLREAARAIDQWPTQTPGAASDSLPRSVASASSSLARGDVESAVQRLRHALVGMDDADTPQRDAVAQMLARALVDRSRFGEAERVARESVSIALRHGRTTAALRHEHARALMGLGRFTEAERELREVLAAIPHRVDAAATRHELSRCLAAQDRLDEAEAVLGEATRVPP